MHTAIFTSGAHSHSITLQDMLWLEPGPSLLRSSWFLLGFASLLAVRENGFSAGTAHCDGQKEAHLLWGGMGSSWLVASSSAVGVLLPFSFPLAGLLSVLSAAPSTAPCICVGRRQKREWKAWKKCSKYNHIISRVNASLYLPVLIPFPAPGKCEWWECENVTAVVYKEAQTDAPGERTTDNLSLELKQPETLSGVCSTKGSWMTEPLWCPSCTEQIYLPFETGHQRVSQPVGAAAGGLQMTTTSDKW